MSTASHLGFIRFKPLVGLLVLGGLVYGGMAFWPVADQYYRLWRAAKFRPSGPARWRIITNI